MNSTPLISGIASIKSFSAHKLRAFSGPPQQTIPPMSFTLT
jgi:hypothetical protein